MSGNFRRQRAVDMSPAIDQVTTPHERCALFAENIPESATDAELAEHFAKCGRVVDLKSWRDNRRPQRFAIVTFESEDDAKRAIANLHHVPIGDRVVSLAFAR